MVSSQNRIVSSEHRDDTLAPENSMFSEERHVFGRQLCNGGKDRPQSSSRPVFPFHRIKAPRRESNEPGRSRAALTNAHAPFVGSYALPAYLQDKGLQSWATATATLAARLRLLNPDNQSSNAWWVTPASAIYG